MYVCFITLMFLCSGRIEITDCIKRDKFDTARFELHQLLAQPGLAGVPLLVVRLPLCMTSGSISDPRNTR